MGTIHIERKFSFGEKIETSIRRVQLREFKKGLRVAISQNEKTSSFQFQTGLSNGKNYYFEIEHDLNGMVFNSNNSDLELYFDLWISRKSLWKNFLENLLLLYPSANDSDMNLIYTCLDFELREFLSKVRKQTNLLYWKEASGYLESRLGDRIKVYNLFKRHGKRMYQISRTCPGMIHFINRSPSIESPANQIILINSIKAGFKLNRLLGFVGACIVQRNSFHLFNGEDSILPSPFIGEEGGLDKYIEEASLYGKGYFKPQKDFARLIKNCIQVIKKMPKHMHWFQWPFWNKNGVLSKFVRASDIPNDEREKLLWYRRICKFESYDLAHCEKSKRFTEFLYRYAHRDIPHDVHRVLRTFIRENPRLKISRESNPDRILALYKLWLKEFYRRHAEEYKDTEAKEDEIEEKNSVSLPPPWLGFEYSSGELNLEYLANTFDLHKESREMQHCIKSLVDNMKDNLIQGYRGTFQGERITLTIAKTNEGFILDEVKKSQNRELSRVKLNQLLRQILNMPKDVLTSQNYEKKRA